MKKKLNLTITEEVHKNIKKRAIDENRSVSEIIEKLIIEYLKTVPIHQQ
mgnify:CR=1 FL=1